MTKHELLRCLDILNEDMTVKDVVRLLASIRDHYRIVCLYGAYSGQISGSKDRAA